MTKLSAIWTYIREYNLLLVPTAVGLPIAAAFVVAGSSSIRPAPSPVASTSASAGSLHVVADSPWVSGDPANVGSVGASDSAGTSVGQRSSKGTARIQLAAVSTPANQVITSVGAAHSVPSAGYSNTAAAHPALAGAPAVSGARALSLSQSGGSQTGGSRAGVGASTQQQARTLPSLATDAGSGFSVRAAVVTQPVAGSPTPQPVQVWVATPRATTSSGTTSSTTTTPTSLTDQLAAAGYNVSGIFSAANPPQLVADYKPYVDEGVSPSYAYAAGLVSTDEAAVFQHLGFTLMKDVTTNGQFWVGPELSLDPEFVPVPASN